MIVGNLASELSDSVRIQIVTLSKKGLCQCQTMARMKVYKEAVNGTLLHCENCFIQHIIRQTSHLKIKSLNFLHRERERRNFIRHRIC